METKVNQDIQELINFILDYGQEGALPNMDEGGSGDIAYEAALRLAKHYKNKEE